MSKLRQVKLFDSYNKNRTRILNCRALANYIFKDDFPLSAAEVAHFASAPISSRIRGLSSIVRWSDLTSLLDESFVWDDIIDGCAQITQARQARLGSTDRVWLSSAFLHSAMQLFSQPERAYTQNLADIRALILAGNIQEFFVVHIADSHASVYHWSRSHLLGFADSLGHAPSQVALAALNWVLDGLDVPVLSGYTAVDIPSQPDGSGSCVIACCNAVQRALGTTSDVWSHEFSYAFRARMMIDFIKYNNIAEEYGPVRVPSLRFLHFSHSYHPYRSTRSIMTSFLLLPRHSSPITLSRSIIGMSGTCVRPRYAYGSFVWTRLTCILNS